MRPRPAGQASLEYVAALALVAGVMAVAATAGPLQGVGAAVAGAVRHGVCVVADGVCSAGEARAAGLAPCPVRLRSNSEGATLTAGVVRVGRDDALLIERRSDGTASVSFLDGGRAGAEAGVGVRFTPLGVEGSASVGGGVSFAAGRTWDFASWQGADAFVGRHARHETLTGEVRGRVCFWCGGDDPPPPSARYVEGGGYAEALAQLSLPIAGHGAEVDARVDGVALLGRRQQGARVTSYLRVAGESAGRLGAVVGALGTDGASEAVLEITSEAGRPVELRATGGAAVGGGVDVLGTSADLGMLAERLRDARAAAARGSAIAAEASVALDLRDPLNLEAARGVLGSLLSPRALPSRLAALASRLDSDGVLDLRVYRAGIDRDETGADAALGIKFGADYERVERNRSLIAAWTSVGGGTPREREDCAAAA